AGNDEGIAVENGAGAERGKVRSGAGLGEAAAPQILATQDAVRKALLLSLIAESEQRRADDAHAEGAGNFGRLRACHLFGVNDLLRDARGAAAVLDRPGNADPARFGERLLPLAQAR